MISYATDRPLRDAVAMLDRKTPVGAALRSGEWDLVPAEIRLRAMFSARVENERLLAEMQQRLQARLELAKRDGRTVDRGVFIEEMREVLREAGYKRGDAKRGSLQDLKSTRRLGLIWDMNIAQAQGYARWKADMTPEGLENEPCYELIRVMERMERRDWPTIWSHAGGEFFGAAGSNEDYPLAQGRMIAAKNDPVWTRISRFGTPWPPFDWGSGMGLRGIDRDEAEALGVLGPDDEVLPLDTPFNSHTKASLKGIPAEGRQRILKALAGDVEIIGDEIRIIPPAAKDSMSSKRRQTAWKPSEIVTAEPTRPDGRSLAEKLRFEEKISYLDLRGRAERTLEMADKIIGGGNLPPARTRFGWPLISHQDEGVYSPSAGGIPSPLWIVDAMPEEAGFAEFAWLHELGHLVDNYGLHTPRKMAFYASENHPGLRGVMDAIKTSIAASRYREAWGTNDRDATPREFFARAFAQFIAEESNDAVLGELLQKWRFGAYESAGWPRDFQWHRPDFKPIKQEMRLLFARNGWKGGGR